MNEQVCVNQASKSLDTFLEYADAVKEQLLFCHGILDKLIGTEPPNVSEVWKEPDCRFEKLHQSSVDNLSLSKSLVSRLSVLENRI